MSIARPRMLVIALIVLATLLAFALLATMPASSPLGSPGSNAHAASKGDPKDCDDFNTQRHAQRWCRKHNPRRDPAGLEADNYGLPCEDLP